MKCKIILLLPEFPLIINMCLEGSAFAVRGNQLINPAEAGHFSWKD
jgi:hypothetical protein